MSFGRNSTSRVSSIKSRSKEKQHGYQRMHPLYNPIDYKLTQLNKKVKQMSKPRAHKKKCKTSHVSFRNDSSDPTQRKLLQTM